MWPRSHRRPPPLPTLSSPRQLDPENQLYKDKRVRPRSLRQRIAYRATRPSTWAALFLVVFLVAAWSLGLVGSSRPRDRIKGAPRVVARSWSTSLGNPAALGGPLIDERDGAVLPPAACNETILILCPMRNAIEHIWHFFHLVDQLSYPRHLVHLAILASDSSDRTYARALELADERQYSNKYRGNRYARISVFEKDFARPAAAAAGSGEEDGAAAQAASYEGKNVGAERHEYTAQVGRRQLLAKSRTWLLSAALAPEVDWVLWLDVDLVDYEPALIERLVRSAKGEDGEGEGADVVVPNCVWKTYNEMGAYDRNNWIETAQSRMLKRTLASNDVLLEGYPEHPSHRFNLASLVPSDPTAHLSPHSSYHALSPLPFSLLPSFSPDGLTLPSSLLTPSSSSSRPASPLAHVPRTLSLDGVGGCAALVRADVHREGAVFPAWPPVDHQLETEGFAQMVKGLRRDFGGRGAGHGGASARRAGNEGGEEVEEAERAGRRREEDDEDEGRIGKNGRGRLLGLPSYYVYHGLYG
ncbi:hypothetical protein JCM3775_007312 [Rhodotorula graminis]|uniref:Glycosyltransferase family 62 protein n=1 Tax=Rhodotorula graminis (strain WP1) TaxID=578459 RepID=A0A0P9IUK1_RHOGW|nr:glycosyltransferase family 62 protein [Rhodotorula graminis WP1]KPV73119.1 glycosyltransferase family 62 protein [Rhodotorula graminis WP1]